MEIILLFAGSIVIEDKFAQEALEINKIQHALHIVETES